MSHHDNPSPSAILLIHCSDRKDLIASVTEFIHKNNGNIIYLDQHVDAEKQVFFMRIEWELANFVIPTDKIGEYLEAVVKRVGIDFHFLPITAANKQAQEQKQHALLQEYKIDFIIEQDVVRVSHHDSIDDLMRKGRDLEKVVLARATRHHLQRKILMYDHRTVVFV